MRLLQACRDPSWAFLLSPGLIRLPQPHPVHVGQVREPLDRRVKQLASVGKLTALG